MGEVVPLRRDLRAEAERAVDALGLRAGQIIGLVARLPATPEAERRELLALAEAIRDVQGFGWVFADQEPAA